MSEVDSSIARRAGEGRRLVLAGVWVNIVLALAKVLGGVFGRSHALIADGIESSLDVVSSLMMWGAIKYAERPPDHDHPYGHGKMESLAAVVGALVLIFAGFAVGYHSVQEILRSRSDLAAELAACHLHADPGPLRALHPFRAVRGDTAVAPLLYRRYCFPAGLRVGCLARHPYREDGAAICLDV